MMQGGDYMDNRLADGNFTSLAGDLPCLISDVTDQMRDVLQERRIALDGPGIIVGENWRRRHTQFPERHHDPMSLDQQLKQDVVDLPAVLLEPSCFCLKIGQALLQLSPYHHEFV